MDDVARQLCEVWRAHCAEMDVKEHVILGLKPDMPQEELVASTSAWRLQGFVSTSAATALLLSTDEAQNGNPAGVDSARSASTTGLPMARS